MDGLALETAGGAIYAPNWEAVGKLAAKMAALMGAVGQIKKDAKNTFHKYDYTSYEALAAHVRTAVVKVGLAFTVSATDMREEPGDKMQTRLMGLELTFTDTETGAMRVMRGYGEGSDNQDKGTAKALTSGVKYMLMRNLLVSEDADVDSDADAPAQRVQTARTAPAAEAEPEAEQQAPSWADDGEKRDMIVTRAANKYQLTIEEVLRIMPPVGEWRDLYPTGKDCMADFEKRFAQAIAHPTETDYHALAEAAHKEIQAKALSGSRMAASDAQRGAVVAALAALTPDATTEAKNQQRHLALVYLFGKQSSKALTSGEASAVIDRYSIKTEDGQWLPREDRRNEFLAVVRTQQEIEGQQRLV